MTLAGRLPGDGRARASCEGGARQPNAAKRAHKASLQSKFLISPYFQKLLLRLPPQAHQRPPRGVEWMMREVWDLYDAKRLADRVDMVEDVVTQSMPTFVTEMYLLRHGDRESAGACVHACV